MKKLSLIIATILSYTTIASAQQTFGVDEVIVKKFHMERVNDFINVNINLDIKEWGVPASKVTVITPILVNKTDSLRLQSISQYGRSRYFYYERNPHLKPTTSDDIVFRKNKMPSEMNYNVSVRFEEWMNGCKLIINTTDYGCCNKPLLSRENTLVKEFPLTPYIPQLIYPNIPQLASLHPTAESVKIRELSGTAYIDFPVSRTEIIPDYHNNTYELNKIIGTIDSVKNDSDITITAISIKGFASPESPYDNNARLAKGRTEALKKYVEQMYHFDDNFIATSFEPEDWEGLQRFVESSTELSHREDLLSVICSNIEPDEREHLLKSRWPKEYKYLLENCYPSLRHSEYKIEYTIRSFSTPDEIEEIMHIAPQKLSLEEFYVLAQTYEPGSEEFNELFETALKIYPYDPIANLIAANSAITKGDYSRAMRCLALIPDMPEAIYAYGAMEVLRGRYDEALPHLERASSLGVKEAQKTIDEMSNRWKIIF